MDRKLSTRVGSLVPLAVLSLAWTASLMTASPATNIAADLRPDGLPPEGLSVPVQAIEAPASVSASDQVTGSVGGLGDGLDAEQVVASTSVNGIPAAALAAYQRAETVINVADASCRLTWQLIAAIGRVESDHGRFSGNKLSPDGVASPGIYGIALDGSRGTTLIRDTDAGQYDNDVTYDRAVGPMQFIPSTWSVVGVDADNDGVRNPQDIDDAALATGVYLCSGSDDLSTSGGQRTAVYRYNHSDSYVALVLAIADGYLAGEYLSVPDGTLAAGYLTVIPADVSGNGAKGPRAPHQAGAAPSVAQPQPQSQPAPAADDTDDDNEDTGNGARPPQHPVVVPTLPHTHIVPVDAVLTLAQAVVHCTLEGSMNDPLDDGDAFDRCVAEQTAR